jgi:hypothetical protein
MRSDPVGGMFVACVGGSTGRYNASVADIRTAHAFGLFVCVGCLKVSNTMLGMFLVGMKFGDEFGVELRAWSFFRFRVDSELIKT